MGLKFEPKKFKFGMRTLKTGIAVFLVLGLFSALGWEGLQIGCLTAVFSLRENFDRSIQFGKSRIFANTVGGLLSLLFYFVNMWFNHSVWVTLLLVPLMYLLIMHLVLLEGWLHFWLLPCLFHLIIPSLMWLLESLKLSVESL